MGVVCGTGPHLEILAVNALAIVGAVDRGLEALAVLLQAAALLAVAALVVACHRAGRQRCRAFISALWACKLSGLVCFH